MATRLSRVTKRSLELFNQKSSPLSRFSSLHSTTRWASTAQTLSGLNTRVRRPPTSRRYVWAIPIVGALLLYFSQDADGTLHLPKLFASNKLIPCKSLPRRLKDDFISSPDEDGSGILAHIFLIAREKIWEPIRTGFRFLHLFMLFMPVILTSPMLLIGHLDDKLDGDRWGAVWWYGFFCNRMEAAGPTFIKLGQWAASRADLFPAELCQLMGAMHSQGKPHPFSHTKHIIERVFRKPFDELFEDFDNTPIGTGAIAQVYRAKLKHDLLPPSYLGPKRVKKSNAATASLLQEAPPIAPTAAVAIKILHPHVHKMISRDLSIMRFFANALTLIPGIEWLSLPEEVDVFGVMMRQQLDLRHEAENLIQFEKNFASRNLPVTFPRPLETWSSRNMLMEEFQNALPLEAFLKNGGGPFDDQIATVGLDAFLNMLLLDNFVHSDLHPGNIMIKFSKPQTTMELLRTIWHSILHPHSPPPVPDLSDSDTIVERLRQLKHDARSWRKELDNLDAEGYIPEVVFIDAGLVTELNDTNRKNFLELFQAVAQFDGYRTGQLMVERCRSPEKAIDTNTFALKMQHLVLSVKRKTFSLGQIKISDVLTEVLQAVRAHHVKMEGDFINTVISVLLLEGIGRQLDPDLDLFKSALPILRQVGRQMSTSEKIGSIPSNNFLAFFKVWVWLEARDLASAAFVNADDLVKYDWLTPGI